MYVLPSWGTWQTQDLPAESVEAVLQTAEEMELLELTLTGGEILYIQNWSEFYGRLIL